MLTTAAVAITAFSAAAWAADAAWKPDRPVTLVVPYAPGGGTDAQARAVARELQRIWGQPLIVINAAGADGMIGTRKVIESKADGYTLLVQLPSLTLIKHLPSFKGVDPVTQLVPVSAFSSLPGVVVANAIVPGRTMAELVRNCRAAARPCSLGTTENIARLQARVLVEENNLPNLIVANYRGGGPLLNDLMANNVNTAIMGITAVLPHTKSGALKVIMTLGHKRSSVLPEVPSATEAGFPSFDMGTWYGIFAPKDTPAAVVQGVAVAVQEAVRTEGARKTFDTIGADALGNTPAEFAAMVKVDNDRYDTLAKRFPIE